MRTSADKIWLIHLHCRAFLWSFTPAHRLTTIFVVRDLLTNDFEMALLHAGKQPEHRANEGGLSVNRSLKTIDYHFWIHPSYSSCHRSGGRVHLDRSVCPSAPFLDFLPEFLVAFTLINGSSCGTYTLAPVLFIYLMEVRRRFAQSNRDYSRSFLNYWLTWDLCL